VAPGFEYEDMTIASTDEMMEKYPQYKDKLEKIKVKQTILKKS
jgi:predicted cupin superfamily sugar epimerase